MAPGNNKQTDLYGFYDLSSLIFKVSFKKNSMSLGLAVLDEKLFTWTWISKSDAIMSADLQVLQLTRFYSSRSLRQGQRSNQGHTMTLHTYPP